jgi:hypothetical protein
MATPTKNCMTGSNAKKGEHSDMSVTENAVVSSTLATELSVDAPTAAVCACMHVCKCMYRIETEERSGFEHNWVWMLLLRQSVRVYACLYIKSLCMHVSFYACVCIYMYLSAYICMLIYRYVYSVCTWVHLCVHATWIHTYIHTHEYTHTYIWMHVCVQVTFQTVQYS